MNVYKTILMPMLLLTWSCQAEQTKELSTSDIAALIPHYFGASALADERNDFYIRGDFNGDGIDDIAVLFKPGKVLSAAEQVKTSTPWIAADNTQQGAYHTSLAIINGTKDGMLSHSAQVFALLDYTGVLETPSFQLIVVKHNDDDYPEYVSLLPVQTKSDLLVLPTEAGIDTYIYWDNSSYHLKVPQSSP